MDLIVWRMVMLLMTLLIILRALVVNHRSGRLAWSQETMNVASSANKTLIDSTQATVAVTQFAWPIEGTTSSWIQKLASMYGWTTGPLSRWLAIWWSSQAGAVWYLPLLSFSYQCFASDSQWDFKFSNAIGQTSGMDFGMKMVVMAVVLVLCASDVVFVY